MGRNAVLERAHQRQARQVREQRHRKARAAKAERRSDLAAAAGRLVKRTAPRKGPLPEEKKAMLLEQFAQACRLPAPCDDLCLLLAQGSRQDQSQADTVRKRPREDGGLDEETLDRIAKALVALDGQTADAAETLEATDEEEQPRTLLEDVVQDECGGRVVCAIIAALSASSCLQRKTEVVDTVMKLFEENKPLYEHYVACKVLSSLVLCGGQDIQQRALCVLRQEDETPESLQTKLRNRHVSTTIRHLIEHFTEETVAWLTEVLCISEADSTGKKKKKMKKKSSTNGAERHGALLTLINDPVASPAMRALFLHTSNRAALLRDIDLNALLDNRRGCKFLQEMLLHEPSRWTAEGAEAVLDVVMAACESNLAAMCTSSDANFVVQALIALVPLTGPKEAHTRLKRVLNLLGPELPSLVSHPVAVHVVAALATTALSLPAPAIAEELAGMLITRSNVDNMLRDPRSSLLTRRFFPLCKSKDSNVGRLLSSIVEQDVINLSHDSIGNVMVQEYVKVCGGEKVINTLIKANGLLNMSQHEYASHVVGCLFDNVGSSTHTTLCNALKKHVVTLSKHVNGRFVVEKAIPASRDICETLLRHFSLLAYERGTQHVLCTLVSNLDKRGKQQVAECVAAELGQLATNQCSSIVLQKLMQSDDTVLQKIREALERDGRLRNNLAQNFYGKFVVNIASAI
ncbi:hypothetical protein ERJ75_001200200 [Trypanosoma vivax]|nr:hypothetical protein ERJ75_001200200 [Trypanosoma vivax]